MVTDLSAAYASCRELHKRHGRTYYLATRLLPQWKRRHVHALYGFTRYADEIVDRTDALPAADRAAALDQWSERFLAGLHGAAVDDPLLPAVLHTIAVFDLDTADFTAFLRSMTMDLTVTSYPRYTDLLDYMEGSAAVIGTMMLPILGSTDRAAAREPARQLGFAFQLTNFIRDVGEDLERGRTYLPDEDLDRFGLTRADLVEAARRRRATPAIIELIQYEIARAQAHYTAAAPGITMLEPASQACIRTAYALYGGILDEVAAQGYDVFRRRATVPHRRRAAVAARALLTPTGTPVTMPGPTLTVRVDPPTRRQPELAAVPVPPAAP
ncbi:MULTISPECIES: phytoene/squalene synthase family protein [unclassified Solwaraspora]|uniref:phytoene/squalene synthase family protein n=1 Tax=unclassified Solwaraspora TaxID=2627926 RepID=UPI00259B24CA|nr:phytoene/squalene synthase family protein [Solwaraspora sp. WMMA2056]WJK41855.1 phytoene/squalene synthase family protein [Solwaraspora sp. WMMA2056]